ncbi:hypothetical protein TNCV_4596981 [Trichonephila clavipes]|uniref:Uncharacterized protein n=1 Tax=Trichonephila clavipes TaxID=2585209 RepID=A0A8X7BJY8_TRICX|nr:hypothetical protein TNCV_4596981 [Trichonephila clavipes]
MEIQLTPNAYSPIEDHAMVERLQITMRTFDFNVSIEEGDLVRGPSGHHPGRASRRKRAGARTSGALDTSVEYCWSISERCVRGFASSVGYCVT